jgi:hypothetical protein
MPLRWRDGGFYEAARRDLGVLQGGSPEAYEWHFSKWMVEPEAEAVPPA